MPNSGIAYLTSTMHDRQQRIPEKGDEQAMNNTIGRCSKNLIQDRPPADRGETDEPRRCGALGETRSSAQGMPNYDHRVAPTVDFS
jgi:hypothetical protein